MERNGLNMDISLVQGGLVGIKQDIGEIEKLPRS
jgi:hypothetical protein